MNVWGFCDNKCKEPVIGKNADIYVVSEDLNEVGTLASDGEIEIIKDNTGLTIDNCVCLGVTQDVSSLGLEKTGYCLITGEYPQLTTGVNFDSEGGLHIVLKNSTDMDIELLGVIKLVFMKYA